MSPIDDLQAQATDSCEMGCPFSRKLPGGVGRTLEALPSVHARDLAIRHDPRPPA